MPKFEIFPSFSITIKAEDYGQAVAAAEIEISKMAKTLKVKIDDFEVEEVE